MDSLKAFVFMIGVLLSILCFGILWGPILFVLGSLVWLVIWSMLEKTGRRAKIRDRLENVYIVSNNPCTGESIRVPEQLEEIVDCVPFHLVQLKKKRIIEKLKDCNNQFYKEDKLDIFTYTYQSGQNINEDWVKFEQWVVADILSDRAKRHAELQAANPDWYSKHGDYQK